MSKDKNLEQMIQEKGLNAPRLTPKLIDDKIVGEYFHIVPNTPMTLCVLTLQNGFVVTGDSTAVSIENFDKEIGRKVARENARDKIWSLEGYLLKEAVYRSMKDI